MIQFSTMEKTHIKQTERQTEGVRNYNLVLAKYVPSKAI